MINWRDGFTDRLAAGCHGQLRFLLFYGSESSQSDADYLAVYDDLLRSESLVAGGADLWAISEQELRELIGLLDPFETEPLLTGRMVFGMEGAADQYRILLRETPVSPRTFRYLLSRSLESYIAACARVTKEGRQQSILSRDYWSALSFSVSYWCYAKLYRSGHDLPVTLTTAVAQAPERIRRLWDAICSNKKSASPRTTEAIDAWSDILLGESESLTDLDVPASSPSPD